MERLSKRGRRELARERRRHEVLNKARRTRTRRIFLASGSAFILAVGVYGFSSPDIIGLSTSRESSSATPFLTTTPLGDSQLILNTISQLGIKTDQDEINLWGSNDHPLFQPPLVLNESLRREAEFRSQRVRELMLGSKNPYFVETAVDFNNLIRQSKLEVTYEDRMVVSKDYISAMTISVEPRNNQMRWKLKISREAALSFAYLEQAIRFVHERRHLVNSIEEDKKLGDMPIQGKNLYHQLRGKNPGEHIAEEARGYASQVRAYFYTIGLTGLPPSGPNAEMAAGFINAGQNEDSQAWRRLIAGRIRVPFPEN